MRKIFLAIFIFCGLSSFANTVIIGTGSGSISKTSMGTLNAGDTLAITAGTYTGGATFANLHDITVINYGGVVTFTTLGWDVGGQYSGGTFFYNVTFSGSGTSTYYGFVFSTMSGDPITCDMPKTSIGFKGLRFERMHFINTSDCFNFYNLGNTYNGTDSTLKLNHSSFRYLLADSCGMLISSSENPTSDFMDSIDIHDCTVNEPQTNGQVVTATIFRFNIYNNIIAYRKGVVTIIADIGKFFLLGNGQLHHNYFYGSRGYMNRIIIATLGGLWVYAFGVLFL